jgi:hypothetical protein
MSFLMMAFGSYGLPRKEALLFASKAAFDILCHNIGFKLSKPISRQDTAMSE